MLHGIEYAHVRKVSFKHNFSEAKQELHTKSGFLGFSLTTTAELIPALAGLAALRRRLGLPPARGPSSEACTRRGELWNPTWIKVAAWPQAPTTQKVGKNKTSYELVNLIQNRKGSQSAGGLV